MENAGGCWYREIAMLPRHVISLAFVGYLGMFIGLYVLLFVPSLWGYSGMVSGFALFALAVLLDAQGMEHV